MHSAAIVLVAFIPMLFAASAYYFLNRVDPDCGATFPWVTHAMGPWAGWMGGWGVVIADIVVMPSLAYIAAQYTYLLFGFDGLASDPWALLALGCAFILVMTLITWIGIELSARTQFTLLAVEIVALVGFSVWALVKVYLHHPAGSLTPSWDWMNPFALSMGDLSKGVLLALFIYWGWDTAANVNEETRDGSRSPGSPCSRRRSSCWRRTWSSRSRPRPCTGRGSWSNHPDDVLTGDGREPVEQDPGARRDDLGDGLDADHDPADRAHDALDGRARRGAEGAREDPPEVPDADVVDVVDGDRVDRLVRGPGLDRPQHEHPVGLDLGPGVRDRVLLRHHGARGTDPVPQAPVHQREELPAGGRGAGARARSRWAGCSSGPRSTTGTPTNSYTPAWFAFGGFKGVGPALVIGIGMLLLGVPLMFWWHRKNPTFFTRSP